jgi:hypothetical protein
LAILQNKVGDILALITSIETAAKLFHRKTLHKELKFLLFYRVHGVNYQGE